MTKEKFTELSVKVLSNEATPQEKEELENLITDESYNKLFLWVSKRWEESEKENNDIDFDVNKGWEKIRGRIAPSYSYKEKENKISFNHRPTSFQVAASIIIFVVITTASLFITGFFEEKPQTIVMKEKTTNFGQKAILTLYDGTKITLNANSQLIYPSRFGDSTREVYLNGEAYFEVVHNKSRPFIVHSGNVVTTVLGTQFNVKAFPDEEKIKVSLVNGKVEVVNKVENSINNKFILSPRQQFVYDKTTARRFIQKFNLIDEVGWKDNTFIFKNVPLPEVFRSLQRAYGIKFKMLDVRKNIKLTADFKNASFGTVVNTIKTTAKLDYNVKFKGKEVVEIEFYKKE